MRQLLACVVCYSMFVVLCCMCAILCVVWSAVQCVLHVLCVLYMCCIVCVVLWCVLCVHCIVCCVSCVVCIVVWVWPDEQLCWEGDHLYLVSFGISCFIFKVSVFMLCSLDKPSLSTADNYLFYLLSIDPPFMMCGNALAAYLPSSAVLHVHSCLSSNLSLQGWHKLQPLWAYFPVCVNTAKY